jgi:hypothetical protein
MATLRASRRSRASLPIRCALGADGFMTEKKELLQKLRCTLEDQQRRVNGD